MADYLLLKRINVGTNLEVKLTWSHIWVFQHGHAVYKFLEAYYRLHFILLFVHFFFQECWQIPVWNLISKVRKYPERFCLKECGSIPVWFLFQMWENIHCDFACQNVKYPLGCVILLARMMKYLCVILISKVRRCPLRFCLPECGNTPQTEWFCMQECGNIPVC